MSKLGIIINNAIFDASMNLKLYPTMIGLKVASIISSKNEKVVDTVDAEDICEEVMDVDNAEVSDNDDIYEVVDAVDDDIDVEDICEEAADTDVALPTSVAVDTTMKNVIDEIKRNMGKNLVDYTIGIMTNYDVDVDDSLNIEQKAIVNGIASLFPFEKIYPDYPIADLRIYDPEFNPDNNRCYIISIKNITDNIMTKKLLKEIEDRKNVIPFPGNINQDDEIDDLSKEVPVTFDKLKENAQIVEGGDITKEVFDKLEEFILPILYKRSHRYEKMDDGLLIMYYDNGNTVENSIVIDPGIVMGKGEYHVLAHVPNDTLFVPIKRTDILEKIISSGGFYELTPEEIISVRSEFFNNMENYRYTDMSNTEFLKGLNDNNFQKLGYKLSYIYNHKKSDLGEDANTLPRYRFKDFKNIKDFKLISDKKVISPMKVFGETSPYINKGEMIKVKGDWVTEYINGKEVNKYKIQYPQ